MLFIKINITIYCYFIIYKVKFYKIYKYNNIKIKKMTNYKLKKFVKIDENSCNL